MILLELAQEVGLHPTRVASTQGGEYKSACPSCGGKDRFILQPNKQMQKCIGYYFCRQCDLRGDSIQFAREFCGLSYPEACDRANASIKPENPFVIKQPKKTVSDPVATKEPLILWINNATTFMQCAHQQILSNQQALAWLASRGLPEEAVRTYQIGYCTHERWIDKKEWGLEDNESTTKLWFPEGIVIPTRNKSGKVVRIKIRRAYYKPEDQKSKYIALSGSMTGYNLMDDYSHKTIMIVESELDAYALHYAVGDFVLVMAIGNNTKNPDNAADYLIRNCDQLLICHDNDAGGLVMLEKLQARYTHAKALSTPFGKDIGEAVAMGLDVRQWIIKHAWSESPDLELIEWILNYISEMTTTRSTYVIYEKEIVLGPDSPRAKTGELQKGFWLMKELIEKERSESV